MHPTTEDREEEKEMALTGLGSAVRTIMAQGSERTNAMQDLTRQAIADRQQGAVQAISSRSNAENIGIQGLQMRAGRLDIKV